MPNVPISALPLTTSVCATALVPIVQNGVTCSTYACLLGGGGGGGAVTQITAGCGITISPACGTGNVTICSSTVLPSCGSFTTCVTSPIVCGTSCVVSPLVCGTSSVCTPTLVATNACITGLSTSGCAVCVGACGLLTAYTAGGGGTGLTSVGLTMPSAFCVCGSPLTSNGSICVSACGTACQLISGCGSLISAGSGITISGGQICSTVVGSVSCIVQGSGICITPSCGIGAVTICATGGGTSPMVSGGGTCSIVGNGCGNTIGTFGCFSFLGGGEFNCITTNNSFLGGGKYNGIGNSSAVVVGGQCNSTGFASVTIGGQCNISGGSGGFNFIGGGLGNISGCCNNIGCYTTIVGGFCNTTTGNCYGGIFTGCCNRNKETDAFFNNGLADFAITLGGFCNLNTANFGLIGNGCCNSINNQAGFNTNGIILNGNCNRFCMALNGVVLSGSNNTINLNCSAVIIGSCNCLGGCGAVVFNGFCNTLNSWFSNVFGDCNQIPCGANCYSTIYGCNNCDLSCGCFNTIYGACNCIPAANISQVTIFGCGITANCGFTTYANNLCVCNCFSAAIKSFDIPHPDPKKSECGLRLKHSVVESPNSGDNIYRYNVTTSNCSASVDLPDYYRFLNNNDQIYVSAKNHLGYGYGIMNDDQTKVDIITNSDGDYNVLILGTRKDELAMKYWDGVEYKNK